MGLCAAGLSACGTTRKLENPTPPWVMSPPPDTAQAYFGVGEGVDLAAAKRAALRDIAARLRVSVSGTLTSQTTVSGNQLSRSQSSRISEEVQKTEFRNPVLVQSAPSPQGVYALMKVDRAEFVQQTREKIGQLYARVQQITTDAAQGAPLERLMAWEYAAPLMAQLQEQYALLSNADLNGEDRQRKATLQTLETQAQATRDALVLAVRHAPEDADVAEVYTQYLTGLGVRVAARPEQANGWAEVAAVQRVDVVRAITLLKLSVTTRLRDPATQRVVASREQVLNASSTLDARAARQQALKRLQQTLGGASMLEAFSARNTP